VGELKIMVSITPEIIKQHNLTLDEYALIQKHLGRDPNYVELGVFSVMWSEHCSYKSSRVHLKKFPTKAPHVLQGPGENAGVIDIGDGIAVSFKIESHNHPSFIEPYNGAATGVGGILRDVFTMGARPICNLNSLRFGSPDHPKTPFLVSGVVAGIAGYGNCIGVPTVAGEVYFDDCYNGNNLVNAMTVGVLKPDKIFKGLASGPGNPVLYIGSKTGRDGIHGATMASDSFDDKSEQKRPTVQVGDPFTEKLLLEACLELMEKDVIVGIQDMGAAGLTSSSVEMASRAGTGLILDLENVPTRETGMTPYEMLLSESQERMLLVAKPGTESIVKDVLTKWDLDAAVIGKVSDDGIWRIRFKGEEVAAIPVDSLTDAAPIYNRPIKAPQDRPTNLDIKTLNMSAPSGDVFKKLLASPTIASKEWVYRQYDHQVMTQTSVLPGSDAAVLRLHGSTRGLAVTVNGNGRYGYLDPKMGGMIAVAESGRNLACSGAKPLAVTDCLNYGNPENPAIMWEFEQGIEGMAEACRELETPVIGGNVSFYNETSGQSIYPTPVIGMVGVIPDIQKRCESFFKNAGDLIVLLGENTGEIGGSEYLKIIHGKVEGKAPVLDLVKEKKLWDLLLQGIDAGLIVSAHDCAEGGLSVALAESSFRHDLGLEVKLEDDLPAHRLLFSEDQTRVVVSVQPGAEATLSQLASRLGVPYRVIGKVGGERINISLTQNSIDISLQEAKKIWSQGFEKAVFK